MQPVAEPASAGLNLPQQQYGKQEGSNEQFASVAQRATGGIPSPRPFTSHEIEFLSHLHKLGALQSVLASSRAAAIPLLRYPDLSQFPALYGVIASSEEDPDLPPPSLEIIDDGASSPEEDNDEGIESFFVSARALPPRARQAFRRWTSDEFTSDATLSKNTAVAWGLRRQRFSTFPNDTSLTPKDTRRSSSSGCLSRRDLESATNNELLVHLTATENSDSAVLPARSQPARKRSSLKRLFGAPADMSVDVYDEHNRIIRRRLGWRSYHRACSSGSIETERDKGVPLRKLTRFCPRSRAVMTQVDPRAVIAASISSAAGEASQKRTQKDSPVKDAEGSPATFSDAENYRYLKALEHKFGSYLGSTSIIPVSTSHWGLATWPGQKHHMDAALNEDAAAVGEYIVRGVADPKTRAVMSPKNRSGSDTNHVSLSSFTDSSSADSSFDIAESISSEGTTVETKRAIKNKNPNRHPDTNSAISSMKSSGHFAPERRGSNNSSAGSINEQGPWTGPDLLTGEGSLTLTRQGSLNSPGGAIASPGRSRNISPTTSQRFKSPLAVEPGKCQTLSTELPAERSLPSCTTYARRGAALVRVAWILDGHGPERVTRISSPGRVLSHLALLLLQIAVAQSLKSILEAPLVSPTDTRYSDVFFTLSKQAIFADLMNMTQRCLEDLLPPDVTYGAGAAATVVFATSRLTLHPEQSAALPPASPTGFPGEDDSPKVAPTIVEFLKNEAETKRRPSSTTSILSQSSRLKSTPANQRKREVFKTFLRTLLSPHTKSNKKESQRNRPTRQSVALTPQPVQLLTVNFGDSRAVLIEFSVYDCPITAGLLHRVGRKHLVPEKITLLTQNENIRNPKEEEAVIKRCQQFGYRLASIRRPPYVKKLSRKSPKAILVPTIAGSPSIGEYQIFESLGGLKASVDRIGRKLPKGIAYTAYAVQHPYFWRIDGHQKGGSKTGLQMTGSLGDFRMEPIKKHTRNAADVCVVELQPDPLKYCVVIAATDGLWDAVDLIKDGTFARFVAKLLMENQKEPAVHQIVASRLAGWAGEIGRDDCTVSVMGFPGCKLSQPSYEAGSLFVPVTHRIVTPIFPRTPRGPALSPDRLQFRLARRIAATRVARTAYEFLQSREAKGDWSDMLRGCHVYTKPFFRRPRHAFVDGCLYGFLRSRPYSSKKYYKRWRRQYKMVEISEHLLRALETAA